MFCLQEISDFNLFYRGGGYSLPLYLYPAEQDLDQTRRINFDPKLYARLQSLAKHPAHGTPDEVAVFDYIYGVLHCPAYRATYAEFLKIDFPRIPWPASPDEFWDVAAKGTTLRKLHLMDPATIGPTPYPSSVKATPWWTSPGLRTARRKQNLDQRNPILRRRPCGQLDLLHRRLPTRPEMAEGPQRAGRSASMT